jgi:hypothetical protein
MKEGKPWAMLKRLSHLGSLLKNQLHKQAKDDKDSKKHKRITFILVYIMEKAPNVLDRACIRVMNVH